MINEYLDNNHKVLTQNQKDEVIKIGETKIML